MPLGLLPSISLFTEQAKVNEGLGICLVKGDSMKVIAFCLLVLLLVLKEPSKIVEGC